MEEYTGYIYSITNDINGKTYIGKTNDLVRRWKEHCYGHGGTAILDKAFKKYGLEHFVFDIIAQIPFDSIDELNDVLNQLEVYYISLYNTYNEGYNATVGGEGTSFYHHSEETKKKISQSQLGKVLTEEHKQKCRIANLGNHHTAKAKEAIRQALLHRDHSIYDKIAAKRRGIKRDYSMIMRGAVKRRKPILQYSLDGNFIREYEGASIISNVAPANILACCKGRINSAYGYVWRYKKSGEIPMTIQPILKHHISNKTVIQLDMEDNIIQEFPSTETASKITGIGRSSIKNCLGGYSKSAGGYHWQFKERKEVEDAIR